MLLKGPGVKALESTITEYDYSVRDGSHIIQYPGNNCNYSVTASLQWHRFGPKYQASAAHAGAFTDLPAALDTWCHNHTIDA